MSKKQVWLILSVVAVFLLQSIIESFIEKDPHAWGIRGPSQELGMFMTTWISATASVGIFWTLVLLWKMLK